MTMTAGQFFLCFLIIIILRESLTSSSATSSTPPPMTLGDTTTFSGVSSQTPVQPLDSLTHLDYNDDCILSPSVSNRLQIDDDSLALPAVVRQVNMHQTPTQNSEVAKWNSLRLQIRQCFHYSC